MECQFSANLGFTGIGVRLSIYVQAVFAIVATLIRFYINGGGPSRDEPIDSTFRNSAVIIFSGLAVSLSALIEAKIYGLSVYQALLMLNLCWVVAIGALVPFFLMVALGDPYNGQQEAMDPVAASKKWSREGSLIARLLSLHSLHFTVASSIGLWVFIRLRNFDTSSDNCTLSTVAVIAGRDHLVSGNTYRITSLVVYAAFVLPIFNSGLLFFLAFGSSIPILCVVTIVICIMLDIRKRRTKFDDLPHNIKRSVAITTFLLPLLVATGLVIINTEQTIQVNSNTHEEDRWTISQALALMVTFIPTVDFGVWTWGKIMETNRDSEKGGRVNHPTPDDLSHGDPLKSGDAGIKQDSETSPGKR